MADQSNILAVNAAIEAVKAGDHGVGFTIVAQEIKSLAEQSKRATSQVRNILNDIQKSVNHAVMSTEQGAKIVEEGSANARQSGETIELLAANVNEADDMAIQITSYKSATAFRDETRSHLLWKTSNRQWPRNEINTKHSQKATQELHDLGKRLGDIIQKFHV